MKRKLVVLVLALAVLSVRAFAGAVRLTADFSADVPADTSAQRTATVAMGDQPVLWGLGWEVVPWKVGLGGDYMVSFSEDTVTGWWLDWVAPALFLGWHPNGPNRSLDPYAQVGIGCAGRVRLSGTPETAADAGLELALFPFVGGGLNVNLDGLMIGAKALYTPFKMGIPVSTIPTYPLGTVQVVVTAGIALGW